VSDQEPAGQPPAPVPVPARWGSPIKDRLRRGEPVFGVTLTTTSLDLAARAASVGFDFLWIEMEHSPITLETLRNIVLATRGLPAAPIARVPVNELWTAKRVLDQGVHGVIFPFTSNVERARQAVAACRYPPAGRRGSGNGLAVTCWPDPDAAGYYDSADENVIVVAVVEEASALEQVEEIAATPGLDVVFIGTSDLSFSLGHRGSQEPAAVRDAIERVRQAAERHGKACGLPVRSAEQAQAAIAAGFRFFQVNSDLNFFEMGANQLLEPLGRKPGTTERGLY
jgi:2-keto-3-deoxy-L-rhamnonate aldolase RhmA